MNVFRSKRASAHEPLGDDERPAKRISTPAGQRLSLILESTGARRSKSPSANKNANLTVTTTSTYCNDPTHIGHVHPAHRNSKRESKKLGVVCAVTGARLGTPRESLEETTSNGSHLSVSVWSNNDAEKFEQIRHGAKGEAFPRWSRKRMVIVSAIALASIIALAVGLALGLKKKPSHNAQPAGNQASPTTGHTSNTPATPSNAMTPSSVPSGFPIGTYSLITFLDTVSSSCTANNATWSCPPTTTYYSDPQKALTAINWKISGKTGSYKISSVGQDATFGTVFQNEKLQLLDAGKATERYHFMISRSKSVNMTGSIGDMTGSFVCDYGATNIQGSLYTKMARTYPQNTIAVPNTGHAAWPYAVRVEQTVAGGENIPSCKKSTGEQVNSLAAQAPSTLCDCLYKNWTPPQIGA
ncbi:hypothetical protein ACEQ8H_002323 [Pleosporales sp. CAS-2024a]